MLARDHSHVLFTLPHARKPRWLAHVPVMTTLLLQAVRHPLDPLLADPQYRGAHPGLIAALHPWSQTLVLHPHGHWLVTGGGLTPDGDWQAVRHGFPWPVRVGMAVLRGQMVDALRRACERGTWVWPEAVRPQQVLHLLTRLGQAQTTPWHGPIRERSRHGAGVVPSLARSLRGGPRTNARLVAWDGERVTLL